MSDILTDLFEEMREDIRNPYFLVLLLILGVGIFVRLKYAFFEGMWVDEARMARTSLEVANHPLNYKVSELWRGQITKMPPLYPYLLIVSQYILGKSEFAIRVVSPIVSVIGIGLTYIMGKEMKNREVGLFAAALLVFNSTYLFLSERILIGATFAVVYTATMTALYYGLEDKEYSKYVLWALGPLTTLTILTKQSSYTLGLIIPIYLVYKRWDDIQEFRKDISIENARQRFSDIGIAVGLGAITLLPWSLRSYSVCGLPLCGLEKAFSFASKGGSVDASVFSVQGPMYFINTMPQMLTIPVAFLLGALVISYFFDKWDEDPDRLVKYAIVVGLGLGIGYLFKAALIPMILISSMALLAKNDAEKLLWIWAGIGIGIMSVPTIKVPRYIVFVIPALLTLASISAWKISSWLSTIAGDDLNKSAIVLVLAAGSISALGYIQNMISIPIIAVISAASILAVLITQKLEGRYLKAVTLMLVIALPILFITYASGIQNAQAGGYPAVKNAGEWMDQNTPEDARILSTSFRQIMYQAYPRIAWMPPGNESALRKDIDRRNISYVVIDTYEKAQPGYTQLKIPPHRVPNDMRQQLANRQISGQEVVDQFEQAPEFLTPLKQFGQSRVIPFRQIQQPRVIVYRVNKTALQ